MTWLFVTFAATATWIITALIMTNGSLAAIAVVVVAPLLCPYLLVVFTAAAGLAKMFADRRGRQILIFYAVILLAAAGILGLLVQGARNSGAPYAPLPIFLALVIPTMLSSLMYPLFVLRGRTGPPSLPTAHARES